MGTFVSGNTALPPQKTNLYPPTGATNELDASDINNLWSAAGDLRSHSLGWLSPFDYGAAGDGVTDDTAAFQSLLSAKKVLVPSGTYKITGSLTFTGEVEALSGAVLNIASGKTVAFNGGFKAGVYQVFSGSGTVTFNANTQLFGYPEWWGAVVNGPDCLSALQSAVNALPVVILQRADYFVSGTLKMTTTGSALRGVKGIKSTGGATGMTRIISTSATANVLQVGTDANPGSVNSFIDGLAVSDVELGRSVGCASNGQGISNPTGVLLQYCKNIHLDNVWPTESLIGFCFNGTVDVFVNKCHAFRSVAAASGTDFWWGYYCNGSASIGLAGGNGSLRFNDSIAEMGGAISSTGAGPITSVGFNADAAFADLWFSGCETSAVQAGWSIAGLGGNASASLRQKGNDDISIYNCRSDTFGTYGFYITALSEYATVQVEGCSAVPGSGTSPTACFAVTGSNGSSSYGGTVELINNKATCWPVPATKGFFYQNCSGIVSKNLISGSQNPVYLDTVKQGSIEDSVNTPGGTANAAVYLTGSSRISVKPVVNGAANCFGQGINLNSTTNDHCMLDPSAIDPAAVNGGSGNKVVINGTQVTAVGASGTHYVTGVMA